MRRKMNTLFIVAILCLALTGIAAASSDKDSGSNDATTDNTNCASTLRIYGTYGEGPGNQTMCDPEKPGFKSENPPYTDPEAPFYPQAEQAPRKDFVTLNPALMDHNRGWNELLFYPCDGGATIQTPKEKVFKRMWYEKEWFKDYTENGVWDIVLEKTDKVEDEDCPETVVVDVNDKDELHKWLSLGYRIIESNNPEVDGEKDADIYGPSINQEFVYMMTDSNTQPIMVKAGSRIFIPMAHDATNSYRGLNSFDADGDGLKDIVTIESEKTLGFDIDGDGVLESMDNDGVELSADESIVLVLENKLLKEEGELQFFDNKVTLEQVNNLGQTPSATFTVCDNEGGGAKQETRSVIIPLKGRKFFSRGIENSNKPTQGPFFIEVVALSNERATIKVGRMFGQVGANIAKNPNWNQKAFIVDEVFYNVAAIKAKEDCFKYIAFRQKLPKVPIKIYGKHLEVWGEGEILPEMPPFNMDHDVLVDVQKSQTVPESWKDKIGPIEERPPLEIKYVEESVEERYSGELKEIYKEYFENSEEIESWVLEWFYTYPDQYTEFVLPKGELYLVTLSWYAPEACIHIWDGDNTEPIEAWQGERVKFWHDPCICDDIYVNCVSGLPNDDEYNPYDKNKNSIIEMEELMLAISDWKVNSLSMEELMEIIACWKVGAV
ncbi:MAG: hypothetical protein PHU28_05970 [Methanosarcinaceae archaeon]|nr:hypothetical protein [Methanosarcinaceae archaeon]